MKLEVRIVFHRNNYEIKHSQGRMLRHFTAINLMPGRVSYVGQSNISLQRVRLNDTRSLNDRCSGIAIPFSIEFACYSPPPPRIFLPFSLRAKEAITKRKIKMKEKKKRDACSRRNSRWSCRHIVRIYSYYIKNNLPYDLFLYLISIFRISIFLNS